MLHHAPPLSETPQMFQCVSSRAVSVHCIDNFLINVICFEANFTQKCVILCILCIQNGRKYIYQPNRQWHGATPNDFFIEFFEAVIHPATVILTSCPYCARRLYIIIMSPRCTPSRLHKGLFLLTAHSFLSSLSLLIKMLNATLQVMNTRLRTQNPVVWPFLFFQYAALPELDALMNG